jgi:hypothetical protein
MPTYTITSEQLHRLEEIFRCLIEVEKNGNLRVVDGDYVSTITPSGAIVQHRDTGLPNVEAHRS